MKLLAHKRGAEAVHRADGGAGQKHLLPQKAAVGRILGKRRRKRRGQALLHLRRRRARKCHDQQPVDIDRILFPDHLFDDPPHKHRGLARSRRRRH